MDHSFVASGQVSVSVALKYLFFIFIFTSFELFVAVRGPLFQVFFPYPTLLLVSMCFFTCLYPF